MQKIKKIFNFKTLNYGKIWLDTKIHKFTPAGTWKWALKIIVRSLLVCFEMIAVLQCAQNPEIYWAQSIVAKYRCYCKNARLAVEIDWNMHNLDRKYIFWSYRNNYCDKCIGQITKLTVSCSCVSLSDIIFCSVASLWQKLSQFFTFWTEFFGKLDAETDFDGCLYS